MNGQQWPRARRGGDGYQAPAFEVVGPGWADVVCVSGEENETWTDYV